MEITLRQIVGDIPSEAGFRRRMRIHQGWWRAFVLGEGEGKHPKDPDKSVCNAIPNGRETGKNFLTKNVLDAVHRTVAERRESPRKALGMIDEDRLFNNLLSSQPLCFNFFGELAIDKALALQVVRSFVPDAKEVRDVKFEYAPKERYTNDNSAFDVAPRFNQLFRNQLLAEALVQNGKYDYAITGLFCHQDDRGALRVARQFQSMLRDGEKGFKILTYRDFIKTVQRLDLDWRRREWTMLLWARYCATRLSEETYRQF